MLYQLLCREFAPPKSNLLVKLGCTLILLLVPKNKRSHIRQITLQKITQYHSNHELETIAIETMGSIRKHFSPTLLDNYTNLPFEGQNFMCFADYKGYLRREYGDYMQLPPENERDWKHHPIILDFENNYEELNHHS